MKIAIIGANGFIGTRLLEILRLGDSGHEAIPIVRRPSGLAPVCRFEVAWRLGDALDEQSLTKALKGCDAVVHVALGDPRQITRMPEVLCEAAHKEGIRRVIYLSSASVHGQAPAPGTTEQTALRTGQAMEYNNAKIIAEQRFFACCKKRNLEGFALRPGVVYGPRSRWIADLAADLRSGQAWLFQKGEAVLNGIYVDNLCHAIMQCVGAHASASGAYLVNDAETVTWREFTYQMATELKVPLSAIHHVETLPHFSRSMKQRLKDAVNGPLVQCILPLIPYSVKQTTKKLLEPEQVSQNPWALSTQAGPRFTEELVLLQQCRWRLPTDKAKIALGFAPPVTYGEAMKRSLAWLAFAEGHR